MTNGEKLKEIFPDIELYEKSHDAIQINFNSVWWNTKYEESSSSEIPNKSETKIDCDNTYCNNCVNHKYCDYESNKSEIPTGSEDCISRKAALKIYDEWFATCNIADRKASPKAKINALPSVTQIRPKGHWIDHSDEGYVECPRCGNATTCDDNINDLHFCFSCGAEMEGVEE